MPKQYGGYNPTKKKTKTGDKVGNNGDVGGYGGEVTWSLSESDIKGYDIPNKGIMIPLPTVLEKYITGTDPKNILVLLAKLVSEKDYGTQAEIIEKERGVKAMSEEILKVYGEQETKGD